MADGLCRSRGRVHDGRHGGENAKEHRHTNANYGGHIELFDHERPLFVEHVQNVHGVNAFSEAMVQPPLAFEKAKMNESGRFVVRFSFSLGHDPIASAEAAGQKGEAEASQQKSQENDRPFTKRHCHILTTRWFYFFFIFFLSFLWFTSYTQAAVHYISG